MFTVKEQRALNSARRRIRERIAKRVLNRKQGASKKVHRNVSLLGDVQLLLHLLDKAGDKSDGS